MSREHRRSPRASADVMRLGGWLVAEAARSPLGHDAASYQALLEDARISVDKGEPGRWFPFAALTQVLLWQNRPRDAADLAEWTIAAYRDDVDVEWPITAEDVPFCDALLGERLLTPRVADPDRIGRVGSLVPPDSVLGQNLAFVLDSLRTGRVPLIRLVGGYEDWEELEHPLHPPYDEWWSRLDRLKPKEIDRLWPGLRASRNLTLARELAERAGLTTPLWQLHAWFAGGQVRDGDVVGARATLLAARQWWAPFAMWDVLPTSPVLQPQLLPVASPEFRVEMLNTAPDALPWVKKKRRRR